MQITSLLRYLVGSEQAFELKEQLILRDHLALVRTRLANETALLSYIRSSLYLLIGGIALVQVGERVGLHYVGYLALALSAGFVIIGLYRYYTLRRNLNRYYSRAMEAVGQHVGKEKEGGGERKAQPAV